MRWFQEDVEGAALHRSQITQSLWGLRTEFGQAAPPPPNLDGTRYPSHARVNVRYDCKDGELRQRYESAFGTMRLGVLLEDMDALAGSVAWRHVDDADPKTDPPILVTASVEEMHVLKDLPLADYSMSGEVVWTGRSSLVIVVELTRETELALRGVFTYVARKRDGSGAEKVFPLVPETEKEIDRYADVDKKQRALKAKRQKKDVPPEKLAEMLQEEELKRLAKKKQIDELLAASRVARDFPGQADDGLVAMNLTALRSAQMCHPQDRNTAGNVFGGVLLRRALEIGFANAFTFAGAEPRLAEIQRVDFLKPVHVGSLLALSSVITFTENSNDGPAFVHVSVQASTWTPQTRASVLNNTFVFIFCIDHPQRPLKKVFPTLRTEAELVVQAVPRYPPPAS